ncbi:MAG: rhamnogalacturonan acetylesterase [Chitinophagaceae bacterium]
MKPAVNKGSFAITPAKLVLALAVVVLSSFLMIPQPKPVLYIIGDSTVRNGDGTGKSALWGWGTVIGEHFDTTRISIRNHAIGGRSSRTFITEGRWQKVLDQLNPGDYVIMQFGHNDSGPLDDTARARGSIRGIGTDSSEIYNPIMKKQEVVHTYGWYMRKYIDEAKAKGAVPIVCSPVPRNIFKDGKAERSNTSYALWSEQVAKSNGAYFIPLNSMVADIYDNLGPDSVKNFFPGDHTHTGKNGAELNAATIVKGIKLLDGCKLKTFLKN